MILFCKKLKTIKVSIVIIFSFITFWITLTSCESYCDYNVGICLKANKYDFRMDYAYYECKLNGSILLEIYDDKYKEVTIKALQKFGLEGCQILFGLEYKDGQFQWLSKREVSKLPFEELEGFQSDENCKFFLRLTHTLLAVERVCEEANLISNYVCLKEINGSTTLPTSTNIVVPNMTPTNFNNNNQPHDNNYDQLNELKKRINGINVGVVISLILNVVVVIVLGICFFMKRKICGIEIMITRNRNDSSGDNVQLNQMAVAQC